MAPLGSGKPIRVQGCFITPEEIDRVVRFVKSTGEAQYSDEVMRKIEESVQEKDKKGGAQMHPGGAAHLGHPADGLLHLLGRHQHQVRQLVDDHHHRRHVGDVLPLGGDSVVLLQLLESRTFSEHRSAVSFAVGRDIGNQDIVGDPPGAGR